MNTNDNGGGSENHNSPENQDPNKDVQNPSDEDQELSRRKAKAKEREILEQNNLELSEKLKEQEKKLEELSSKVNGPREQEIIQEVLTSQNVQSYNKDVFEEAKKKLLDKFPMEKAIKYAMMEATEKEVLEEQDEQRREESRKDNSLAPRGGSAPAKEDKFPLLPKSKFGSLLTDKVKELGEKAGQQYYKDYCKYQEANGRKYYQE